MAEKEKQKETGENYEPKKAKWQYRYATLLIVCFISSVSLYCFPKHWRTRLCDHSSYGDQCDQV